MKILPFVTQSHPAFPNLKNIQKGSQVTPFVTLIQLVDLPYITRH